MTIKREEWIRALTANAPDAVLQCARDIAAAYEVQHLINPQAGLGMLKMADGAFAEPFFLGEFPASQAHIRLLDKQGVVAEGAATVMADSVDLAEALAICDAVMAYRLPGQSKVEELMAHGQQRNKFEEAKRRAMLDRTQVDFSLLNATGEDDE